MKLTSWLPAPAVLDGEKMFTQQTIREEALRPLLTDVFLSTLVEAARVDGWNTDYVETSEFIRNIFDIAGKKMPDLEPYYENECGAVRIIKEIDKEVAIVC